ncbi:MAG: ImmA/IrrE family metallo-endopeptidase [Clostridiales bacterium]|nr:ImmA/IrrE family metallo-endopeptidase [Clostridiales bacterium]
MIYYQYSPSQLESKAIELTQGFDKERLIIAKPIDVYDVVDYIGCTPDWVYLTPNQSYLGMTAYNDGYWWAWPEPYYEEGMLPTKIGVSAGTILIDRTISEGENRGIENFTVIHECFHQILHPRCFRNKTANYQHFCQKKDFRAETGNQKIMTAIERIEAQANYCAAAFLMPKSAVEAVFMEKMGLSALPLSPIKINWKIDSVIKEMAAVFSVNYSPMKYRLQTINLLSREDASLEEYLCS